MDLGDLSEKLPETACGTGLGPPLTRGSMESWVAAEGKITLLSSEHCPFLLRVKLLPILTAMCI